MTLQPRPGRRAPAAGLAAVALFAGLALLACPPPWGAATPVAAQSAGQAPGYTAGGAGWVPSSWWIAGRTTGYWFETLDPDTGTQLQRFSFYQTVDGSITRLASGHLDLRFAGRFADADRFPTVQTNDSRLYSSYAQVRFDPRALGRLGRMFVQEGPASLTLDGLWIGLQPARRIDLRLWGGTSAPEDLDWEVKSLDSDAAAGARVLATLHPELRAGLSWAYLERDGRTAARPVGLETTWFPLPGLRAFGRAEYETVQEEWGRLEVLGDYRPRRDGPWGFGLQFLDRRPRIEASSYFARFGDLERIEVLRGSVRYQRADGLGAEAEYYTGIIGDETSARISGAVLTRYGRIGYSALLGDAGEDSRWFGDVHVPITPWAQVAAGAVVSTYALLQDAPESEERDLVTLFGRATISLRDGVRGVAEVQGLQNPDFDQDIRVLLGLDLFAGHGASGFGLPRGGWLQ
jgi:hypothetical protein